MAGIPIEVEPRDGEEDPAEAIPFVMMGRIREGKSSIRAALRRAVHLWSLFTGALRGCVFGGIKLLGLRVRSDGASYCAWVLNSGIISVSVW